MPRRICFVSAEFSPFAKSGGLGDVSSALTKHLHRRGHELRVFVPLHGRMDLTGVDRHRVDFLQGVPVPVGPYVFNVDLQTIRVPDTSLWIYLVDCPSAFHRPSLYTSAGDEHLRFLLLTRAAFECCQRMNFAPEVLHCNDWHTAFAPLLLRTAYAWDRDVFGRTRSVLTIHNIGYQGTFSAGSIGDLSPGVWPQDLHQADLAAGRINPLRHGVLYADAITTVSPTYADEIRTPEGGYGLDGDLRRRGPAVVGILNGVDYGEWDPGIDRYIDYRYGPDDLDGKARNKAHFLEHLGLAASPRTPLIGMVSRLTVQKGIDLLYGPLPEFLATRDIRLVALGSGDAHYETFMRSLQERFPDKAAFHAGYSEQLAHWIEAASDMFLMPSLYEPCGLNQMYSLRYGTVPIVRRTGGLADSVQHFDPATGEGTGVVFEHFDADAVRWALAQALDWYAEPGLWERIVRNGMRVDYSWDRQGAAYERLYDGLASGA